MRTEFSCLILCNSGLKGGLLSHLLVWELTPVQHQGHEHNRIKATVGQRTWISVLIYGVYLSPHRIVTAAAVRGDRVGVV